MCTEAQRHWRYFTLAPVFHLYMTLRLNQETINLFNLSVRRKDKGEKHERMLERRAGQCSPLLLLCCGPCTQGGTVKMQLLSEDDIILQGLIKGYPIKKHSHPPSPSLLISPSLPYLFLPPSMHPCLVTAMHPCSRQLC